MEVGSEKKRSMAIVRLEQGPNGNEKPCIQVSRKGFADEVTLGRVGKGGRFEGETFEEKKEPLLIVAGMQTYNYLTRSYKTLQ